MRPGRGNEGRRRARRRHPARIRWLGSGAIALGLGAASLAGASGVAQAATADSTNSASPGHVAVSRSSVQPPAIAKSATTATVVRNRNRGGEAAVPVDARARAKAVPMSAVATNRSASRASTTSQTLFTGEPTVLAKVVVAALRVVDAISARIAIRGIASIFIPKPPWCTSIGLTTTESQFGGMPVWTLQPSSPTGQHVIAVHGGGYMNDPSIFHWLTYANMARATGATVVVPMYPLESQGGTAATAVPQMADFLGTMVAQYGAENVSVLGDSAGGGLALAATQELGQRGEPTPGHMVLLSPWLDITLSNPAIALIHDPVTSPAIPALKVAGLIWAGDLSTSDPAVSPLYGSLDGLPQTTVYAGSLDAAGPDVLRLQAKAIAENADFTFVLRAGEFHDWPIAAPLPDSVAAMQAVYKQLGIVRSSAVQK
jgi:triacylglycerol lipase